MGVYFLMGTDLLFEMIKKKKALDIDNGESCTTS